MWRAKRLGLPTAPQGAAGLPTALALWEASSKEGRERQSEGENGGNGYPRATRSRRPRPLGWPGLRLFAVGEGKINISANGAPRGAGLGGVGWVLGPAQARKEALGWALGTKPEPSVTFKD